MGWMNFWKFFEMDRNDQLSSVGEFIASRELAPEIWRKGYGVFFLRVSWWSRNEFSQVITHFFEFTALTLLTERQKECPTYTNPLQ